MDYFAHIPWWILIFMFMGVIALTTALSSLFLTIGRRPKRIRSSQAPTPIYSWDFLQSVAGVVNAPVQIGGQAKLLNNGDQFFPEIVAALKGAKSSINFMVYIWEPGQAFDMIFESLCDAQKRGVEVRLLFDGFGAHKVNRIKLQYLAHIGAKICWFRPARFGTLLRFYKRNHRRAIIIDGSTGFTGGAAIQDKWLGNARNPSEWRDVMIKVTGPMAQSLQSAFTQLWADTQGEILIGNQFYPYPEPYPEIQNPGSQTRHISVNSSPSSEFHPMSNIYWMTFKAARKSIYITQSYFVPDKAIRDVIKERAKAGVDVRVLVPNRYIDGKLIRWASHRYFDQLLESGVKIYEYQPTMVHSKTIAVDGSWSVVGSANMDVRSTELNKENVLCISDTRFALQLEETFLEDIKKAKQIELPNWRKRLWIRRVREFIASLFEEQY